MRRGNAVPPTGMAAKARAEVMIAD